MPYFQLSAVVAEKKSRAQGPASNRSLIQSFIAPTTESAQKVVRLCIITPAKIIHNVQFDRYVKITRGELLLGIKKPAKPVNLRVFESV
jgi:hypothetical protein